MHIFNVTVSLRKQDGQVGFSFCDCSVLLVDSQALSQDCGVCVIAVCAQVNLLFKSSIHIWVLLFFLNCCFFL